MMALYAFMDVNAGFWQGVQEADTLEAALKLHAADVGLIPEGDLDLFHAEVTREQIAALEAWTANGSPSDTEPPVEWIRMSDENTREILGYGPPPTE